MILIGNDGENKLGVKARKSGRVKNTSEVLDSAVFPGSQGGPLMHVIAAKAVAFGEALKPEFTTYQKQIQQNAKHMANEFKTRGYNLVSDGTDNHLILVDLRNKKLTGKIAEESLDKAGITVNKNMVPFDTESPFVTSGIRLGTPALTTRGFKEAEFSEVVRLIDEVLQDPKNESTLNSVKQQVQDICAEFPLYDFVEA
jgi:glycine hydroxymethyltransferase